MAGRRPNGQAPQMRHHKASGRAYVYYQGRTHYLGPWNAQETRRAYRDWITRWEAANREEIPRHRRGVAVTVADLAARHAAWAERHYVRVDGSQTDEIGAFRLALTPLLKSHADKDVETIIGRDLADLVAAWQRKGLALKTINKMLGRIKRVFVWGAWSENGLVSETTAARLSLVRNLTSGEAAEAGEVHPVPMGDLIRTLMHLDGCRPMLAAMARLQFFCGARPGEVCALHSEEIHRRSFRVKGRLVKIPDGVAVFEPRQHKTKHRGHVVYYTLGPESQAVLAPWLEGGGHAFHLGGSRDHIGEDYYSSLIVTAAGAAGAAHWSPGQLRHNFLTRWDTLFGNELGSAAVRHKHLETTAVYVQRDLGRVGAAALVSG